jgi:hypothetical protein
MTIYLKNFEDIQKLTRINGVRAKLKPPFLSPGSYLTKTFNMKKQIVLSLGALISFASPVIAKADGEYCREYTKNVSIGGKIQQAFGTACMLPDGTWKMMNEDGQYTSENINIIDEEPQVNYVTNNYYEEDYYPRRGRTSLFTVSFGNGGLWRRGMWHPHNHGRHYGWRNNHHRYNNFAYNNDRGRDRNLNRGRGRDGNGHGGGRGWSH